MNDSDLIQFTEALISGNRKQASAIAKKYASSQNQIKVFYEQVMKPALYEVGKLWEFNLITVATEHLATSISESVMNELYDVVINSNRVQQKVVLGCMEDEFHQVGVKIIADVFEMHGWDTYFLGSHVPQNEFISYIRSVKPHLIALSLSIYSHFPTLEKMLQACTSEFPELPVIVGGQAFLHGGIPIIKTFKNVVYLKNLEELDNYINQNF